MIWGSKPAFVYELQSEINHRNEEQLIIAVSIKCNKHCQWSGYDVLQYYHNCAQIVMNEQVPQRV